LKTGDLLSGETPGPNAPREEWFLYYFNCKKAGKKFTHEMMSEKIGYSSGYTANLYADWVKQK
jgi:hypothetical protein